LHGICYDFFFVTGFMYTDKVADASIRGQAQGMLVFFTQGIGMYFGYWVADLLHKRTVTGYGDLTKAIADSRPKTTPSFVQSLLNMFSVDKLNVDAGLLSETMAQWKSFWLLPAGMAAVITAIFFLGFWDKMSNHDKDAIDEGSAG
jgi:hypothetical protein